MNVIRALAGLLLLIGVGAASAETSKPLTPAQVVGTWKVAGQSDDGSYHFKGTVEISPVGNVFRVTWKVETVKSTRCCYAPTAEVTGVGQVADANFAVGYTQGLVVARPQPNGTYAVKWFHLSEPYSGFETWSR